MGSDSPVPLDLRLAELEHRVETNREILGIVTIFATMVLIGIPIVAAAVGGGRASGFFGGAWNTMLLYGLLAANTIAFLWGDVGEDLPPTMGGGR